MMMMSLVYLAWKLVERWRLERGKNNFIYYLYLSDRFIVLVFYCLPKTVNACS
jgi:hypothetical protein